ncbi:MAG: hypothetical protein HY701_04510 [Gemmatimonadetes bacterium]|nr:hypothetical protein [Gemmatimonadota bacterium]
MVQSYRNLADQAERVVSAMPEPELRRAAFDKVYHELLATDRELDAYKLILDLWKSENPIKTNKLQVLLAVNALLVSGLQISGDVIAAENWPVYAAGAVFSVIWTLSIGRTSLYQEIWQIKLRQLQARHEGDPRFQVLDTSAEKPAAPILLRCFGAVSSRWYLVFSPFGFAVAWLLLLAVSLGR